MSFVAFPSTCVAGSSDLCKLRLTLEQPLELRTLRTPYVVCFRHGLTVRLTGCPWLDHDGFSCRQDQRNPIIVRHVKPGEPRSLVRDINNGSIVRFAD